MTTQDTRIDTGLMLAMRYKQPVVLLSTIITDYFPHLSEAVARRMANNQALPFPCFKTDDSSKAQYLVHLSDLAACLDKRNEAAKKDWQAMHE